MHDTINLTEIAFVVLGALGFGLIFQRLKQPAALGYVLAGIMLGPSFLSLIENRDAVNALAELGVLMLLFLIGIELNLRSFRQVWAVSFQCVLLQIFGCFGAIYITSFLFGWSIGTALLIGFIVALSSTAVAVKMLEESGELHSDTGRLTIGILIAQDLLFIPMILIVRGIGSGVFDMMILLKTVLSIVLLLGLVLYLSKKERTHIPLLKTASSSNDILPLLGLFFCFGAAALSGVVGLSASYGAFLAGLILGNTAERQQIIRVTHPVQSILIMVFFLSVGLLLDVDFLMQNIMQIMLLLIILFLCKTALNVGILKLLGQRFSISFLSSLFLAQLGEFSFLLSGVGREVNLLTDNDTKLVISLTVLSLMISPLWMIAARRAQKFDQSFTAFWEAMGNLYRPETKHLKTAYAWIVKKIRSPNKDA